MNVNINLPQNNAPSFGGPGFGFGPVGGGYGGPNSGGISINISRGEEAGKCRDKKKSKRSGGLLGGIKDFLRNIGEAIFGEKDDKKCKKGCPKHHRHHRPFGGPSAMAHVMRQNHSFGF